MLWEMSDEKLTVAVAFVCAASFIAGWLADRIMNSAGFGVIGNWLLLCVGAGVGLYTYNAYGFTLTFNTLYTIAVGTSAATAMLILLAGIKSATNS